MSAPASAGAARARHAAKLETVRAQIAAAGGSFALRKRTASNLFRYAPRQRDASRARVDLGVFNEVIGLDAEARLLEVEGLATFEAIVDYTLPRGFVPLVTPELKHITLGGASVGIGIESTCHRFGFVHDMLVEAEVLLPDGRIVVATADNEYSDLFAALGNSYGTLGYILRAKIRLLPAKAYVRLDTEEYAEAAPFLDALRRAADDPTVDFVESLMYAGAPERGEPDRLLAITSRFEDAPEAGRAAEDILRKDVFYKLVSRPGTIWLTTKDYLFRYDPEWFWNIPETWPYRLLRRFAPNALRHSGFYKRWLHLQEKWGIKQNDGKELLIQDWEVPWDKAEEMLIYAMRQVDLSGKPWLSVVIRTPSAATLYPIRKGELYFNLGCYCRVFKSRPGSGSGAADAAGAENYWATRLLDQKCLDLGGLKMLYSTSFMDERTFDALYNGAGQRALKAKYDPQGRFPTLYEKCVRGR